jgi:transcriptional regulator with XRE-family HTH domain
MDIRKQFGIRVKQLRKDRELSQEGLAHLAEIDRTYIPSIEKGDRNVSLDVIQKIAKAFNINISELFKGIEL